MSLPGTPWKIKSGGATLPTGTVTGAPTRAYIIKKSENNVYESVMAEIHRQTTIKEIESMIKEDTVYPVMNWINGK